MNYILWHKGQTQLTYYILWKFMPFQLGVTATRAGRHDVQVCVYGTCQLGVTRLQEPEEWAV